jgi:phosphoserine phosphatase RsbU/P
MENNVVQVLKENLWQRKQNIADFLKKTDESTISTRIGPNKKTDIDQQLHLFDQLLQKVEDKTLGLCEICHEPVEAARLEMDYNACVCLSHLSGEERSKLENDLELSQKVQQALLPHAIPSIKGLEIAAFSQPARIVGGDYFDFLQFKDGVPALAIADVMGKGMPASMLMSNLQASLRIITPENSMPAEVISRLNNIFCHNIRLTKFVTFFLGRFDETTRIFTYCNAGHNPPLLRHSNGSIEWLRPTGAAIGLIEQSNFYQQSVKLEKGTQLLLYTDGVVESFNKQEELFGEERLVEFFGHSYTLPPLQMITALRETLRKFTLSESLVDDTTIIAVNSV